MLSLLLLRRSTRKLTLCCYKEEVVCALILLEGSLLIDDESNEKYQPNRIRIHCPQDLCLPPDDASVDPRFTTTPIGYTRNCTGERISCVPFYTQSSGRLYYREPMTILSDPLKRFITALKQYLAVSLYGSVVCRCSKVWLKGTSLTANRWRSRSIMICRASCSGRRMRGRPGGHRAPRRV